MYEKQIKSDVYEINDECFPVTENIVCEND